MQNLAKITRFVFAASCLLTTISFAHRPIHVLIITEVGSTGYECTCIRNGIPYVINELQHPGIGADSVNVLPEEIMGGSTGQKFPLTGITVYDSGFVVDTFGNAENGAPIASASDAHRLVSILPNFDVLFFFATTAMGNFLSTVPEKDSLLTWMQTHGTFALAGTIDTHQLWTGFDSVLGGTFPNTGTGHTTYFGDLLADTTPGNDTNANYLQLSAGLSANTNPSGSTVAPQPYAYRFYAEWYSEVPDPRLAGPEYGWSNPGIVETFNEASLTSGASPTSMQEPDATPMVGGPGGNDHPMSWYRIHSLGGRLAVQAVGESRGDADTLYGQDSYLRNSIYDEVLWAAGFTGGPTSGGSPASIQNEDRTGTGMNAGTNLSRLFLTGTTLMVSFLQAGPNTVEIRSLDGRLVASSNGLGVSRTFPNLRPNAVYEVMVSNLQGRQNQLIAVE